MGESGAGLERLLEDLVRRAVESSLSSFAQQIRSEVREEIAQMVASPPVVPAVEPVAAAVPAAPPAVSSSVPALSQALSLLLQPTGQAEIMTLFLQSAGGFASRSALFVRRGDGFTFWRAEGFSNEAAGLLRSVTVPANAPGIFAEVSESRMAVSSGRSAAALPAGMLEALGDSGEETVYLFPVVVQGRVVAALYADSGDRGETVEASALEILACVTGLSLETASGRASAPAPRPTAFAKPAAAPQPSAVAPGPRATVVPPSPPAVAASLQPRAGIAPVAAGIPSPPDTETMPEADRDAHRKAYRSARVAVQDLLAYPQNQDKIVEGRKNKTLYRLLKEEIDKNRETYQKRYGQTAACSFDYLHYELVTKLAENKPEVLGSDYPGAVTG